MILDPMGRPRGAQHYMARYWRGELSLAHSFWLTNIVVDIVLGLVEQFLLSRQEASANPLRAHRLYTGFLFAHMFLFTPWQTVGLWRSARRHIATTSCQIWGRCAQGILVLGIIVTLITVPYWLPMYVEMAKMATRNRWSFAEDRRLIRLAAWLKSLEAVADQMKRTLSGSREWRRG